MAALQGPALATTPTTFYLHGAVPWGNAQQALWVGGASGTPRMDPSPPTDVAPKVATWGAIGNPNVSDNPFMPFWDGPLQGLVSDVQARLWVQFDDANGAAPDLVVTLWSDGTKLSQVQRSNLGVGLQEVAIDFGTASDMTDVRLQISVFSLTPGRLLYDSTLFPSSVSFNLGAYVPPPPGEEEVVNATPAAGWGNVVKAGETTLGREASLALDPTRPGWMAMCTPTGVPDTGRGHSFFVLSKDDGKTWSEIQVEQGAFGDTRQYAFEGGDCDVAYDAGGTLYSADTWLGDLSVGHSRDGGATWTGTALATTAPVVDRPWLVGGPDGTVHLAWQDVQFAMPTAIWYTRSTDHGQTFLPAVPVVVANATRPFSWEGNLVVAPGGQDLYLIYTQRLGPQTNGLEGAGPESVFVAASHDGGLLWAQHLVAPMPNPASFLYASLAMDGGGGLHAVFASRTSSDHPVWYAYSGDQGLTWSAPEAVLGGVAAYSPWVAGGAALGEAAIAWFGTHEAQPKLNETHGWYAFAGRVTGAHTGSPTFIVAATTTTPLYEGVQTMPEFNQVRLDAEGDMHLGVAAFVDKGDDTVVWGLFHQQQS